MMKLKNMSGQRFGRWLVIERVGSDSGNGAAMWKCKCDCGNERIVNGTTLRRGHSKSCGCLRKETKSNQHTINLIGQRIDRWTVVERAGSRIREDGHASSEALWKCRCDCGNERIIGGSSLRSGGTKSCGCYMHDLSGENHWNWKGGITPERNKYMDTKEYKEWRKAVFRGDSYLCTKCELKGVLNAHHLYNYSTYPTLRLDVSNGVTLCKGCHNEFHTIFGNRDNDPNQFIDFLLFY
jgi:hypothetical protein